MKKHQQIKYKILLVSILSILSVLIILLSNYKINSLNHKKENQLESLTELTIFMGQVNGLEKDFFSYEVINPTFYQTGVSPVLKKCNSTFKELEYKLIDFSSNLSDKEKLKIKPYISKLSQKIHVHNLFYDSLSMFVLKKGFQDYGLIGKMREEAHFIEKYAPFNNKEEILMLRRHEKDYFLRKQPKYIIKAQKQISLIKQKLSELKIDSKQKKAFIESINNYNYYFNQITKHNQLIGIKSGDGLKGKISQNFIAINKEINFIKIAFKQNTDYKIQIINILNLIALLILIIVITLSVVTSKKLGLPIFKLTKSIEKVIESDFSKNNSIYISETRDEIGQLGIDIQKMLLKIQLNKEELIYKQEEIQKQNDLLTTQKIDLDIALKDIALKNKNLTSSITYAKRLQEAILPEKENIDKLFPNNFVIYKPRDIVSGDYYTVYEKQNKKIVIAIDCTGHGVPGAFMTLLASMVVSDYMRDCDEQCPEESCDGSIFSPKKLMEKIDHEIRKILKQEKTLSRDGMDMAICVIDKKKQQLIFSGAKLPIILVRENIVKKVKGSKRTVGGLLDPKMAKMEYEEHYFDLTPNTKFYLFSDGFQDQFGGYDDTKFKQKKIEDIIFKNHNLPMTDQKTVLEESLNKWMNPTDSLSYDQIDDIMLLGFEV